MESLIMRDGRVYPLQSVLDKIRDIKTADRTSTQQGHQSNSDKDYFNQKSGVLSEIKSQEGEHLITTE